MLPYRDVLEITYPCFYEVTKVVMRGAREVNALYEEEGELFKFKMQLSQFKILRNATSFCCERVVFCNGFLYIQV